MHMPQNFNKENRGIGGVFNTTQRRNVNGDIQRGKVLPLDAQSSQSIAKPAKGLVRNLEVKKARLDKIRKLN